MKTAIVQVLRESEFFRGMSPDACRTLSELCVPRDFRKKETLFRQGTEGHAMFLLAKGAVQLSKMTASGSEVAIRTVKRGDTFAEVILFEEARYPVTATALAPSRALSFQRQDILRWLGHAEFRNDFIAMLMRRQRYLAERVQYLTAYDVEARFLLFLKEHYGPGQKLTIDISKKDIATAIGATPETLSRLIQRLKRQGTLTWQGKTLQLFHRVSF